MDILTHTQTDTLTRTLPLLHRHTDTSAFTWTLKLTLS